MHEYFYLRVHFYLNITKEILPVQMGKICAQSTPIKSWKKTCAVFQGLRYFVWLWYQEWFPLGYTDHAS